MARADLLLNLVRTGSRGDQAAFRRTVEALIAEERAKQHHVLAEQLKDSLKQNGTNGGGALRPVAPSGLLVIQEPRRQLDDLLLPDTVRAMVGELVEEHHRRELLQSHGLEPRNRVLLVGPPGNGKSSLAEALAYALGVPMLLVRYEALIGSYLGETASRLGRLFEEARQHRCVLFFDEFETLGKERGDEHETGEVKRVVASLLLQIDALPPHCVAVTATNHPELLDRAVWRRFQLRLELPAPTREQRVEFFQRFSEASGLDLGFSPRTLADKVQAASFSDLEDFCLDLRRRAALGGPNADGKMVLRDGHTLWREQFSVHRTAPDEESLVGEVTVDLRAQHKLVLESPKAWLASGSALLSTAEKLLPELEAWAAALEDDNCSEDEKWEAYGSLVTYEPIFLMLTGLAIENFLKGLRVAAKDKPLNSKGSLSGDFTQHKLIVLAKYKKLNLQLTSADQDLLKRLEVIVRWGGRYPHPKNANEMDYEFYPMGREGPMEIARMGDREAAFAMARSLRERLQVT